ncbi:MULTISPECIES: hypothetical protein [unclassified Rhizobium]|uniref:hypothetical protein n=1 Tax=unclassified Rhizobium TaxID=2613769 RepID=UPI001ADAD544|nr:hypothetical protein [Rhizobium sp. 16-449-1b]MBO9196067.1 hypothetical protein [Rhizobium sp. 16-449-1b]
MTVSLDEFAFSFAPSLTDQWSARKGCSGQKFRKTRLTCVNGASSASAARWQRIQDSDPDRDITASGASRFRPVVSFRDNASVAA